jgi:hypothetical protein
MWRQIVSTTFSQMMSAYKLARALAGVPSAGVLPTGLRPLLLSLAALAYLSGFTAPAAAGWSGFELTSPGSAVGAITAVSRALNPMEVFWVAGDGSVQHAWYYDGSGWNQGQLAPPGSAVTHYVGQVYNPYSAITVVSRAPNTMEVFWVAPDFSIQHAWYYDGSGWNRGPLTSPGSADGWITAVSRAPNTMEVFWVAGDGSVQHAWYYDNEGWNQGELASPGSAFATPPGLYLVDPLPYSAITVVSRAPNTMEFFWLAPDLSVQHAWYYDGDGWNQGQLTPPGSAGGAITAVSRASDTMEIFWVAGDGSVQHAWYYDGSGWSRGALTSAVASMYTGSTFSDSRGSRPAFTSDDLPHPLGP